MNSKITKETLVSIIVPVYGVESYIERCARSLFEQSYKNIEYVFVDDCSPDKSIDILMTVLEEYPDRKKGVNVVKNISNRGQAAVRNIGVEHCHGQFIMHVDSDDWIDTDVVEKCLDRQAISDADIVIFDRKIYRKNGCFKNVMQDITSRDSYLEQVLRREREISIWGMLIRTTLYTDNDISCKEGINMSEDYQTTPRLAYYARNIVVCHDVWYNYECRNQKSISAVFTEKNVKQELVTLSILSGFFSDKELIFQNAFRVGEAKQLCYFRNNSAFYDLIDLYEVMSSRLLDVPDEVLRILPFFYKISLRIKNVAFLKMYIGVLKFFKRFLKS